MGPRAVSALLRAVAVVAALSLAVFQRLTGPSYPVAGSVRFEGDQVWYRLARSHAGAGGLRIALDVPESVSGGTLHWRRFRPRSPGSRPRCPGCPSAR